MDRENKTKIAHRVALISGIFCAVVALLLILNFWHMKQHEPLESATIEALVERLSNEPNNEVLNCAQCLGVISGSINSSQATSGESIAMSFRTANSADAIDVGACRFGSSVSSVTVSPAGTTTLLRVSLPPILPDSFSETTHETLVV